MEHDNYLLMFQRKSLACYLLTVKIYCDYKILEYIQGEDNELGQYRVLVGLYLKNWLRIILIP